MSVRMGIVCLLFASLAQAQVQEGPEDPPFPLVNVNCGAGQSVQAAVDAQPGAAIIVISGVCNENVVIRNKDISLRGSTQGADGIRSLDPTLPALIVMGPLVDEIRNLAFSQSAGLALSIRGASVTMTDCRFENNGGTALQVNGGGAVTGLRLFFNGNAGRSMSVSDAQLFCTDCDISGNNFAVLANRGAVVSLLNSVVTGRRGIAAVDGGTIADLDCASVPSGHACSLNVTGVAAQASGDATVALVAAGDFSGQIGAFDRGTVELFGARQIAGAANGQGPDRNLADSFGSIVAGAFPAPQGILQSRLLGASASHFSKVLLTEATTLQGSIQCTSAADAWVDPTIVVAAGSTVSGCDHGALPQP